MTSRNTITLSSAVVSEILSISPLNKTGFFPRDFLTWDPDFMMGTSFAFLFCACRGSESAHRFAAAEANYLFKKLLFWYTLNMNEMYTGNNILRRFSDMLQGSLSLYLTEFLLGLLEPSLSWPLLLLSISVAFLNIVTSKQRKKYPKSSHCTHLPECLYTGASCFRYFFPHSACKFSSISL